MRTAVRLDRDSPLTRPPGPTDLYGVDLLVVSSSGRKPFILKTVGANSVDEVRRIAAECRICYPEVNRIDAFFASGQVEVRLVRDRNFDWRRVHVRPQEI